jgi:LL-diaminopimelate aminotransferase
MMGQTGRVDEKSQQFGGLVYMACRPENDFFPDLSKLSRRPDVIYFCSPNNPTGATATR